VRVSLQHFCVLLAVSLSDYNDFLSVRLRLFCLQHIPDVDRRSRSARLYDTVQSHGKKPAGCLYYTTVGYETGWRHGDVSESRCVLTAVPWGRRWICCIQSRTECLWM